MTAVLDRRRGDRLDAVDAADAAGSLTGPSTWLLVGIAPAGTRCRGERSRTWPRFWAWASRAVSDSSPNVVSISFSVEVCSNGPW